MASKNRVSVNLSEQEYKELAALANTNNVTMSWLGRQAISQLLERNKDISLQLPLIQTGRTRESRT